MKLNNSEIICFKHCDSRPVFCKKLPATCPVCSEKILSYILEPSTIPYPCGNATENPCSIAVRPSAGNFLDDYKPTDDLHIAIVNSQGRIFEFDRGGLMVDDFVSWKDCLCLDGAPESWYSHWDSALCHLCNDTKWREENYKQDSTNCFSFVMDFLELLNYSRLQFLDKEQMCESIVLPKIREALRYISIYRELKFRECYVAHENLC